MLCFSRVSSDLPVDDLKILSRSSTGPISGSITVLLTPTVQDMASSSQPNTGRHDHEYDSSPVFTHRGKAFSSEGVDDVSALLWGGRIGVGDVVFVSTFAHERVADAIIRCGAEPLFIDVTLETWHVSAEVLDMAARWCLSVGSTPKALVMVDVYGIRSDVETLRNVCSKLDMMLVDDPVSFDRRSQVQRLSDVTDRRRKIQARYRRGFEETRGLRFMPFSESAACSAWMMCVLFEEFDMRDRVMAGLENAGLESKSMWRPLHTLPTYVDVTAILDGTADYLFEHGLCLPSSSALTDGDVDVVIETVLDIVG